MLSQEFSAEVLQLKVQKVHTIGSHQTPDLMSGVILHASERTDGHCMRMQRIQQLQQLLPVSPHVRQCDDSLEYISILFCLFVCWPKSLFSYAISHLHIVVGQDTDDVVMATKAQKRPELINFRALGSVGYRAAAAARLNSAPSDECGFVETVR